MPLGNLPICGLIIWVVAVEPVGLYQRPSRHSSAVFSCAPAIALHAIAFIFYLYAFACCEGIDVQNLADM